MLLLPRIISKASYLNFKTHLRLAKPADKPGSVLNSHLSRMCVTTHLKQPTRIPCGHTIRIPIWPCSEWGLPSPFLFPETRCALTTPFHPYYQSTAVYLSVALSVSFRLPGVTWHSARWSPDFPPSYAERLFGWLTYIIPKLEVILIRLAN